MINRLVLENLKHRKVRTALSALSIGFQVTMILTVVGLSRGMLEDVVVLMGGEFGRTPRIGDITPDGRSHWPEAGFLWLAGGGLQTGQVIGATDARGERVVGNPIQMQNVLASLYPLLGIDPALTLPDHNGRPQYLLENREPVAGLV